MAKSNLPIEAHDHFRKANILHGYVVKDLAEATKHALETGIELIAAKSTIPHGSWESECDRLFDGSARTARFYMQFANNMNALSNRQTSAVLLLEHTLDGAAKLAKKLASAKEEEEEENNTIDEQPEEDIDDPTDEELDECEEDETEDEDEEEWEDDELEEDETIEQICERETSAIESYARQIAKLAKEAQKAMEGFPTLDELNARVGWERKLNEALATLRGTKPVKCPCCDGDNTKCACKGNARVTKQQYGQMV